jgi:hypothetical protein
LLPESHQERGALAVERFANELNQKQRIAASEIYSFIDPILNDPE